MNIFLILLLLLLLLVLLRLTLFNIAGIYSVQFLMQRTYFNCRNNRRMALIQMDTQEQAIEALVVSA